MGLHTRYVPPHYLYIDPADGNDARSGTSKAGAIKTLAAHNALTIRPGTEVLLRRGTTAKGAAAGTSERIVVPSSGLESAPIIYAWWGSGANPIIDSTIERNDFALDSGAIWKRNEAVTLHQVFCDNVRMIYKASKAAMVAGSWAQVSGVLYVWASDDGDVNTGHVIDYEVTRYSVDINAKSNLVFDGIDCIKPDASQFYFQGSTGSKNVLIKNSVLSWAGFRAVDGGGYTVLNLDNIRVSSCTVHDCIHDGVHFGNGSNYVIDANTLYNCGADITLKGYVITSNPSPIVVGIGTAGASVRGNNLYDNYIGAGIYDEFEATYIRPTGVVIEGNTINMSIGGAANHGIVTEGTGTIIRNNVVLAKNYVIDCQDDADGTQIYNNTLYGQTDYSGCLQLVKCTNVVAKNNLMCRLNASPSFIEAPVAGQTGFVSDYNVFYQPAGTMRWKWGTGATSTTIADWRTASSQDAHSAVGDPLVVAYGTNWHLGVGSPCIGAGVNLGHSHDFDRLTRGNPPDAGAYQYV